MSVPRLLYSVAQKECNTFDQKFQETRDRMKELCALLRIEFFSEQDDTKLVNFDQGVFMRQCHFHDLPFYLKSYNLLTE